MIEFWIQTALSNAVVAAVLTILILLVAKRLRPQVVHVLWLLVLAKLISPPILSIPVAFPMVETEVASRLAIDPAQAGAMANLEAASIVTDGHGSDNSVANSWLVVLPSWSRIGWAAMCLWIAGSLTFLFVTFYRAMSFNGLLKRLGTRNDQTDALGKSLCQSMGVKTKVRFLSVNSNVSPMVWWFARDVLVVVPGKLFEDLTSQQQEMVLAHELAHVKRYDYLVRWLEWVVSCVFWWNPLVYLVRNHLRDVEEICCDQVVLNILNPDPHCYAQSIFSIMESLVSPDIRPPVLASQINSGGFLERRFEMILSCRRETEVSFFGRVFGFLVVLVLVPIGFVHAQDFEKLERRLERMVEKGHLDEKHVAIMLEALAEAVEDDEDHEGDHEEGYEGGNDRQNSWVEEAHAERRRELHQGIRVTEERAQAASEKIMAAVEAGKLTELGGHKKLEAIRKGAHQRIMKMKEALDEMADKVSGEGDLERRWRRLEMAVEKGMMSEQEADKKMVDIKRRQAQLEHRNVEMEIKRAVEAGKISAEDAEQKLSAIRDEIFRGQDREHEKELKRLGMQLRIAVASGDMTKKEAKQKYDELMQGMKAKLRKRSERAGGKEALDEAMVKIRRAVKAGKLSKEQAAEKIEMIHKKYSQSHEEGHSNDHDENHGSDHDHDHDHDDGRE